MFERIASFLVTGMIYGIGALGLGLSFRYLRFPDFTVLGALVFGGIASIATANEYGLLAGLVAGVLSGVVLGVFTALLHIHLEISPVLAGVITFIASFSPSYFFTVGGRTDLDRDRFPVTEPALLHSQYDLIDALILGLAVVALCGCIAMFMRTKIGVLLLAMGGDQAFVQVRHHRKKLIVITVLALGNGIVALAGSLHAFKSRTASVQSHFDFLPFALGGIFAGTAVIGWLGLKTKHASRTSGFRGKLTKFMARLSVDRSPFALFLGYACGALFLTLVSGSVHANVFGEVSPVLKIPSDHQEYVAWALVAALIVLFVSWAGVSDEGAIQ